jgi:hypothetical protein
MPFSTKWKQKKGKKSKIILFVVKFATNNIKTVLGYGNIKVNAPTQTKI